jgi:precorrin-8X/cobalt-precorrin-8 methylmutase
MEWHTSDAQSLAIIDQEVGSHTFSPAEYELVRRVIYATADFEYKSLLRFSETALASGAAALAARTTVVTDVPMVQAGLEQLLQQTFANSIYCGRETPVRPQNTKTVAAWGMETLARRFPEAIFVIGHDQNALTALIDLIEAEEVRPALIVSTPTTFLNGDRNRQKLQDSLVPHIRIEGRKGSAIVGTALMEGLVDLAWQAYGSK